MQKLQDSVFSIVKTTNLSPAVFSFLQPTEDFTDKTPLGGILEDTKHGWLALGPKFCVVDLGTGLKIAARTFGTPQSSYNTLVTSVVELPRPLSPNSIQLVISLQSDESGMICVLHVNGSQLLRCIQTEVVITELAICDRIPDGPFTCFDGVVMAGSKSGELFVFDLNRAGLIQALKDISQGYEHLVQNEANPANLTFLHFNSLHLIEEQKDLAVENDDHLAVLLNENSLVGSQYIFRNPDGTVRMKAERDHVRVTVLQYIPQLGSLVIGFNFGAFQIWNIMTLELEFTSQVNVECLPVTRFGFQEPCDDPRAFCYLWVVFSAIDRFEEEEFPLAVMYSLTYQGKRMLSDTKCLYQEFSMATIRFQLELGPPEGSALLGGKCVSCHTYSVNSTLAAEGEESMLNICQIVWECWGESPNSPTKFGMLLFDLDQWYKDQMPARWQLESSAFMSVTWCGAAGAGGAGGACATLDVRLRRASLAAYAHATRLEEHFYPNSLQYSCICLNTSEVSVLKTTGIQRQIISSLDEVGPTALLNPSRLYHACVCAGLTPLYVHTYNTNVTQEEQRRYLLSVALEARLSRFLKRCAHDWATGSHSGVGCTLTFLVDWCWSRAIELKENATDLTAPLFSSSALPDRNVVRCLEHCVQQLTQLTGLLDAILTKCCNLIVPDALSGIEQRQAGVGTVALYLQALQWLLRAGLLPERADPRHALPYPRDQLARTYAKRRLKLNRLQDNAPSDENDANKPCSLLYIDQLIEQEFGGDRIRELWIKGGSECNGLYPPPSLYSLLRLYLLPDIAEEHKHSLVLYLLVDYSMVYDEVRYEAVIRGLMQFPTMFGLSNTAIKATQAFWHLDHRDFDFALDQLQCLTGNTLSDWQHNVVLSSLLAQKKTQAALQYLHVRKPAPIQSKHQPNERNDYCMRVNDHDKLQDWQACCNLYLARGLVFEALDVIRTCVQNAQDLDEKVHVLRFFFRGCRDTGNIPKVLQVTLSTLEEDVFVKYLEECNDSHASDMLVMYYLQQSRYLEAERYNNKLKLNKPRTKDMTMSIESLLDVTDRESARDAIVEVVCSSLPSIANKVAHYALDERDVQPHVLVPRPMSVFVKAKSPKNTFTYKSSFIQDTIENASETWLNKPKMRKGIKRALNIEETPFICTPKLIKTRSVISYEQSPSESTPPKRARLDLTGTPKTPKVGSAFKVSDKLSHQMSILLDMPDVQSPDMKIYNERSGTGTPHSILKTRRNSAMDRDAPSPVDSRYLGESDDEMLETASNHTHYSDSKHLRFTIPTASESGSTPSPTPLAAPPARPASTQSYLTADTHTSTEHVNITMESPTKKQKVEESIEGRKSFKDNVRARRSLSISVNSSLSDDPNTSIESIADIPITLINPRYSGEKRHKYVDTSTIDLNLNTEDSVAKDETLTEFKEDIQAPKTPKGRRGIRAVSGESTPLINRSRSVTPERQDSPIGTPVRSSKVRNRSRTPELSPHTSPLAPIPELPKQETESEPHATRSLLSVPRPLRSRSRTPERKEKSIIDSPKLEAISESPTKSSTDSSSSSPSRRSLRSRSRTPEVEIPEEVVKSSPRSLRSRSKTPEKLMSPKKELASRTKKSLSRLVLEHNTFAKTKVLEKMESEETETESENSEKIDAAIKCTPMKTFKQVPSLMDVTLSPIANKSVLPSSADTTLSESIAKDLQSDKSAVETDTKPLPNLTILQETQIEKSVLHSYESSVGNVSNVSIHEEKIITTEFSTSKVLKPLPAFTLNDTQFDKSVLHSFESSIAENSSIQEDKSEVLDKTETDKNISKPFAAFVQMIQTDYEKSVLNSAQSSIAESKDDSKTQEVSSLITNDSDVEMEVKEVFTTEDSQDTAEKKEKEKIVEIEREINELEGDLSDEQGDDSESGMSGDSVESGDSGSGEEEEEEDQTEEEESIEDSSAESDKEEIINLDSSESEDDDNLEIAEQYEPTNTATETNKPAKFIEFEVESQKETTETESTTDPLNQGNISLLTDDNTTIESDKSDVNLNYSDEKMEVEVPKEVPMETEASSAVTEDKTSQSKPEELPSPAKEVVDCPHVCEIIPTPVPNIKHAEIEQKPVEVEKSDVPKPKESIEDIVSKITEKKTVKDDKETAYKPMELKTKIAEQVTTKSLEVDSKTVMDKITSKSDNKPVVEIVGTKTMKLVNVDINIAKETTKEKDVDKIVAKEVQNQETKEKSVKKQPIVEKDDQLPTKEVTKQAELKKVTEESDDKLAEGKKVVEKPSIAETKILKPIESIKEAMDVDTTKHSVKTRPISPVQENIAENVSEETQKPVRKKRGKSTSSNISNKDEEEIITPAAATRKRRQSNTSTKSIETEEKSPESITEANTSRRRAKTPTSTEVRKIITRRVSREMNKSLDESKVLEESVSITPKKRATRSRSKNIDDNESVASESSVISYKSKEDDSKSVRKGKKSVLAAKPELSVIPEITSEEKTSDDVTDELSTGLRMTRRKQKLLESWHEPGTASPRRRLSTASRQSKQSLASDDDDASSTHSAFDVQPIDRISLLNKPDFEGSPDREEMRTISPTESLASDAGMQRRLIRGGSEGRAAPKAAKIHRRISADIESPGASPMTRGRRASFTRACEALHTPKGRRLSTDLRRGEGESPVDSPATSEADAPATPARRTRRAASTQSNTSVTKSDTSKRSKKSVVDESKDTKKK